MQAETRYVESNKINFQHALVVFFMVVCFVAAWWLTPKHTWFKHIGSPQFEQIVPKQFGDWAEVADADGGVIVDPEQQEAVNNLYTQVVSRVYVQKTTGRRIMLSLAYGDNQTFSKQLHRPEACYSSQGFKIENLHEQKLQLAGHPLVVNRMTGVIGQRIEQVTYWIRIGDKIISGPATALNKARMAMGLKGYVADGLLFRVSEVAGDAQLSYEVQDQFIQDFLKVLSPAQQLMLIGPVSK
ncbi:MAG: EpsI family protein [Bdellovibrio sp.]|nr:EpsI family protein [Methylotenera sp.]